VNFEKAAHNSDQQMKTRITPTGICPKFGPTFNTIDDPQKPQLPTPVPFHQPDEEKSLYA
jgi:hypothetical protein